MVGLVTVAKPKRGCSAIEGPPKDVKLIHLHWFVIIERGQCNFLAKVENAFEANYSAVIIEKTKLTESDHLDLRASNIPSVFIGQADGRTIIDRYTWKNKNFEVRLTDETPY